MNAVRRFTLARPLAAAAVAMALVAPAGDFTAIAAEPPVDEGRSVGPALALSDPIYEAAREAQDSAVVAGDAGVRLAAWRDHRTFEQTHGDIYATRLAADGTVLDPAGIAIVTLPEAQTTPAISWSGEVFLIVWADSRDPWEAHGVYGARVTGAGEVLDPDGFAIGLTSDPSRAYPQVAWDGTTFLVTWQGDAARLARTVAPNGSVGDVATLVPGPGAAPRLATIGGRVFAAWADWRGEVDGYDAVGRFVDPALPDLGPDPVRDLVSGPGDQLAVAVSSASFGGALAWREGTSESDRLRVTRLDESAAVLDPAEIVVGMPTAWPALGPVDGGVLVAYAVPDGGQSDVVGRVLAADGTLGPPLPLAGGDGAEAPSAIGASPPLLVGWTGAYLGTGGLDVIVAPLTSSGSAAGPWTFLATAAQAQELPAVVATSAGWLAAWSERQADTSWDVRVGRLDDAGAPLDGPGALLAGEPGEQRYVGLAWNGTRGVVVWRDAPTGGRVYARVVDAAGTPAGHRALVGEGARDGSLPAIASDGTGFLVAWNEPVTDWLSILRVQRLDADGARIGGAIELSPTSYSSPALAWVGGAYVVAWLDWSPEAGARIVGARILSGGTVVDEAPFAISRGTDATIGGHAPTMASSGDQVLVAWISGYQETQVVEAARVGADGQVLDGEDIQLAGFDRSTWGPAAAWNGQTYLVAWTGFGESGRSRVLASEVSLGGALVGPAGGVLLDIPVWATQLRAASGTGGRSALAYDLAVAGPPIGAARRALLHFVDVARTPVTGASVTIAGGAAATRASTVAVATPAKRAVRVALSNDGRHWRELPYAASISWSLTSATYGGTSANGTKTVHVRWQDATGRWTPVQTDRITFDTRAPTATAPVARFVAGSTASSRGVAVRLTWTGEDTGAGVVSYEVARSRSGGPWATVATGLASPVTTVSLPTSGSERFRVRARDRAGNVGAWAAGATFEVRGVSELSSSVAYAGRWTTRGETGAWGGRLRFAAAAGASATYRFTGRSVAWLATYGPTRGSARVYVDGQYAGTVSLRRAATTHRIVAFARRWPTSGPHTLRVVVAGTPGHPRVDVDAFLRW